MPTRETTPAGGRGGAALNPTEARRAALREVMAGKVDYVSGSGAFYVDTEEIAGARRRTFAEVRRAGLVTGGGEAERAPLALTDKGRTTAREWGIG